MEKLWTIFKLEEDGRWVVFEEFVGNAKQLSDRLNILYKSYKNTYFNAVPNNKEE